MQLDKHTQLGLRAGQFVFGLIVLSLCSYIDQWTVANTLKSKHAASPIGFLIFTPVMSILSTTFLTLAPCFLPRPLNRLLPILLTSLNSLFYLCGFIALTAYLANLNYCRGSVCDSAKAASFFAAVSFLVWTGETSILTLAMVRGQRVSAMPIKDDYEDDEVREDREDHEEDDHSDGFQRKHMAAGEKLSDVKL